MIIVDQFLYSYETDFKHGVLNNCAFIRTRQTSNRVKARVAQWVRSLDLTAHTSLSPIRRGFAPSFVIYKKGCTRLAAVSDKVYICLPRVGGTPTSSTTKSGRHAIAEILLKVALNTKISNSNSNRVFSILVPLFARDRLQTGCSQYLFLYSYDNYFIHWLLKKRMTWLTVWNASVTNEQGCVPLS